MNIGPYKEIYFNAYFVEQTIAITGEMIVLKII